MALSIVIPFTGNNVITSLPRPNSHPGAQLLPLVRAGVKFVDGRQVERQEEAA